MAVAAGVSQLLLKSLGQKRHPLSPTGRMSSVAVSPAGLAHQRHPC